MEPAVFVDLQLLCNDFDGTPAATVDRIKAFIASKTVAPDNRDITRLRLHQPFALGDEAIAVKVQFERQDRVVVILQARVRGRAVRTSPLLRLWHRYREERDIRMRLEVIALRQSPRGPVSSTRMSRW